MRFFLLVLLVAILSAGATYLLPWWSIAVVCFVVSLLVRQGRGRAFLMGFAGAGLAWLVEAMMHDLANEHILSTRMAVLFHLPNFALFVAVTVLLGGLVGGLAALTGGMLRPKA